MRPRDLIAPDPPVQPSRLSFAPLPLRLILGLTMLWAGAGKLFVFEDFTPAQAQLLRSFGVEASAAPPWRAPQTPASPAVQPRIVPLVDGPNEVALGEATPAQGVVRLRNVHFVTLIVAAAADPESAGPVVGPNRHGVARIQAGHAATDYARGHLPRFLGHGAWPPLLAWTAALIQLLGGAAVLLGVGTRAAGVAIALVMASAFWLAEAGPYAAGGAPDGFLGVLPPIQRLHPHAWKTWLWQMSLAATAISLALSGPGRWSLQTSIGRAMAHFSATGAAAPSEDNIFSGAT